MKVRNALVCIAALAATAPAFGHHSFAMFNQDKNLFIEGTVKDFEWSNPHAWLTVVGKDNKDKKAKAAEWNVEMGSPGQIARGGWRKDTVKPGDKVTVEIHPLRDGTNGGQFLAAKLPDGRLIGQADGGTRSLPAPGGDEDTLRAGGGRQ